MKSTANIVTCALLLAAVAGNASALEITSEEETLKNTVVRDISGQGWSAGTLDVALQILNLYIDQPQWKNDLLAWGYKVFGSDKNARFADFVADAQVQAIYKAQNMKLIGGPMLGRTSEDSVSMWVRTFGPASVTIKVDGVGDFGPVKTSADDDFAAVIKVDGLKPNTSYPYKVMLDGAYDEGAKGVIRTVNPTGTRIVFGTCPHRWGLTNPRFWERVRSRNADALLMYGDVAVQDRRFEFGMHRCDYMMRDLHAPWRHTAANIPTYVSWDDHDYLDNDLWGLGGSGKNAKQIIGTDADRLGVRRIFMSSWLNPSSGFNDDRGGIFFHTRIGAADVIMTDNRYFRGTDGPFLGNGQMKWLKEELLKCKGPFTVISCGTMWSDYKGDGKDSWGVFDPEGREELFTFIEKNHIPGVILISGDRHGARGYTIPRPSGYKFYEFEPASLGGRGISITVKPGNEDVSLFGLRDEYAFGEFSFDTRPADPTVTFRLIKTDGTEHYSTTLTSRQLTP